MSSGQACIVALGASTAVGRDAWSTAAAVRAGISGFTQHPYAEDSVGERVKVAFAPWVDIGITGVERFEALLFPAIDQVLPKLVGDADGRRIALALALPAPRPGLDAELHGALLAATKSRYQGLFTAIATFQDGHAAGLLALDAAQRQLMQDRFDVCVVAGVDSYLEPETLEWLEQCEQLNSAGPQNNSWGFIPGEGAAALLLVSAEMAGRFSDMHLGQVLGVGTAVETKLIKTPTVCVGEGLTTAFRSALQSLPGGETVSDVYCDLNGEPYRADEYGFTCLRTKEYFRSASDFVAPADCCGDVCAASAPLHIGLAAIAAAKRYSNGSTALVCASSEQGSRAAAVLRVGAGASHV